MITRLDRACRDVADYLKLSEWCLANGKRLVVLDDPSLDTSAPQGRAMATMRAMFAQLERELAKARNKERHAEMVAQGKWPGGRRNYGYRYDADTRKLTPDLGGTAEVLGKMADMAIDGESQWQTRAFPRGCSKRSCAGEPPLSSKRIRSLKSATTMRVSFVPAPRLAGIEPSR